MANMARHSITISGPHADLKRLSRDLAMTKRHAAPRDIRSRRSSVPTALEEIAKKADGHWDEAASSVHIVYENPWSYDDRGIVDLSVTYPTLTLNACLWRENEMDVYFTGVLCGGIMLEPWTIFRAMVIVPWDDVAAPDRDRVVGDEVNYTFFLSGEMERAVICDIRPTDVALIPLTFDATVQMALWQLGWPGAPKPFVVGGIPRNPSRQCLNLNATIPGQ